MKDYNSAVREYLQKHRYALVLVSNNSYEHAIEFFEGVGADAVKVAYNADSRGIETTEDIWYYAILVDNDGNIIDID